MSRVIWGDPNSRVYETGIDRGVFYPKNGSGVPWNGLIAISEAPSGSDIVKNYYDGESFRQQRQGESFAARISAYSYPKEFEEHDGFDKSGMSAQTRKLFNLSYRTKISTDENADDSYLIHLVYNAMVSPYQTSRSTVGANAKSIEFEWNIQTLPEILPDGSFSAHVIINPKVAYPWAVSALEDIIYGNDDEDARFPSILEVVNLFENASILRVYDNEDGTFTVDGPEEAIEIFTTDWETKRVNIFKDPLAKTIDSSSWGSTGGLIETFVDSENISWARFTRAASGNVRLADIKVGTSLLTGVTYKFSFTIKSSVTRTVSINVRRDVTSSSTATDTQNLSLVADEPQEVDLVFTVTSGTVSSSAGLTIFQNGSTVGDTLDITNVNVELLSTIEPGQDRILHGDLAGEDWRETNWSGIPNASTSIRKERLVWFEIDWPSAIYIDTNSYRISSL